MPQRTWHALSTKETLTAFAVNLHGLSEQRAQVGLRRYGPNELTKNQVRSPWLLFFSQFSSPLIYLLFGAALIASLAGQGFDAGIILIILLVNAIIGYIQEQRAETSLQTIKELLAPVARVIRAGTLRNIPAFKLTLGDIVELSEGTRIPADIRLLQAFSLTVDESSLTGESVAVEKSTRALPTDTELTKRSNILFAGTSVVSGHGLGIVLAIGSQTEIGKVVQEVSVLEEPTPLADEIKRIGTGALWTVLSITALVALVGLIQHRDPLTLLLTVVASAVSAIPEGLPVLITVTLALGVRQLTKQRVAIKRLASLEALGQINVIVSDKTGTLTENELMVQRLYLPEARQIDVSGSGYETNGSLTQRGRSLPTGLLNQVAILATTGTLANNAQLTNLNGAWNVHGDPTEGALLSLAMKLAIDPEAIRSASTRIQEIPFQSKLRFMASLHRTDHPNTNQIAAKGNIDVILERCRRVRLANGTTKSLSEQYKQQLAKQAQIVAADGYRVLALATAVTTSATSITNKVSGLTFLGFVAMLDAPRPSALPAIQAAKKNGIRVLMATGDSAETAEAVARQLGLLSPHQHALTETNLNNLSTVEFHQAIQKQTVFAEISPDMKLKLVQALREDGAIVAVTGDGVNDAPILKNASVGIAMGKGGTDIARETADMVLLENNFDAIPLAISEGKQVVATLRRVVWYLLCTNLSELILLAVTLLLGFSLPLLPTQILWINVITDGVAVSGLLFEPLHSKKDSEGTHILSLSLLKRALLVASALAALSLWIYLITLRETQSIEAARSTVFIGIAVLHIATLIMTRSLFRPLRSLSWSLNPSIFLLAGISIVLTLSSVSIPFVERLFHTVPLTQGGWGIITIATILLVTGIETQKEIVRVLEK